MGTISGRRPLTGIPTVLPILAHKIDTSERTWLRVPIPGRPAGRTGWITTLDTTRSSTPWRMRVRLRTRRLDVYDNSHLVRRFRVVVGASSTPTPRGTFFIEELVALEPAADGGPFALATSARSDVLQEFNGGPGQIALHGMRGLHGKPGTASSHGCVRLTTAATTWLAHNITPGTPLVIK
jgi:lipoprotein-anchoring transpeptidase ErfK/SrfK